MAETINVTMPDGRVVPFPATMPREEIEAVIREFYGTKAPAAAEPEPSAMDTAIGLGKAGASGLALGLEFMAKVPDYAASGLSFLLEKPMEYAGLERITPEQRQQIPKYFRPTDRDVISEAAEKLTGGGIRYEGKTDLEKLVQAGGEGLPFGALGGARAALVEGVLPSMASEKAGQIFEGSALEPIARLVAGMGTPAAIEGSRRLFKTGQLSVPAPASAEQLARDKVLSEKGILGTVGQIADDPVLMAREAATQVGRDLNEKQLEAFTSEALKLAGINATRATADVLDDAFVQAGKQFDDVAAKANIPIDENLAMSFRQPIDDFLNTIGTPTIPKVIRDIADEFTGLQAAGREITGKEYQSIAQKLRTLKGRPTPELKMLGKQLEEVMVEALGNNLGAKDLAKYSQLKTQYRNLDTLTNAVDVRSGLISPSAL